MRDVFRELVLGMRARPAAGKLRKIGVVSSDRFFVKFLEQLLANHPRAELRQLSARESHRLSPLVLDLDRLKRDEITGLLKQAASGRSENIVVYDPTAHPAKTGEILEKLARARSFTVLAKPVPVPALLDALKL